MVVKLKVQNNDYYGNVFHKDITKEITLVVLDLQNGCFEKPVHRMCRFSESYRDVVKNFDSQYFVLDRQLPGP